MVGRFVQIIEQLARYPRGATLAALARATGVPKSSLHRLLGQLEAHGAVTRTPAGYRLSDRLVEQVSRNGCPSARMLRRVLMPYLTGLQRGTGLVVGLAVLAPPDVVYLERLYGHAHGRASGSLPDRARADRTAAGRLLLALEPVQAPDHRPGDGARLLDLAGIRARGIATSCDEHAPGVCTVAAPVAGPDGRPAAALTVWGHTGAMDLRATSRHLRQTAHAASLVLRRSVPVGSAA